MVNFGDVKVGDRVRLMSDNGDAAEVTVVNVTVFAGRIESAHNTYFDYNWDSIEIIPKPVVEPAGLGAVVSIRYGGKTVPAVLTGVDDSAHWYLAAYGWSSWDELVEFGVIAVLSEGYVGD